MDSHLDKYVGEWDNECGWRLCITRLDDNRFSVSLLAKGQPIERPWYGNQPSTEMIGEYDAEYGLVVELWEKGKGFSLHLGFELTLSSTNKTAMHCVLACHDSRRTNFWTSSTLCSDR